jgi:hypothetical protein
MSVRITDDMTRGSHGFAAEWLAGKTIKAVYPVEDSDRREFLLALTDGTSVLVSCDPSYADDLVTRTEDRWEVVLYDSTDIAAGRAVAETGSGS